MYFLPPFTRFATCNGDSELHQADMVKEEQWLFFIFFFIIYQDFRTYLEKLKPI